MLLDIKEAENDHAIATYKAEKQVKIQILILDNLLKQYYLCVSIMSNSVSSNILNTPQ
jgi:hypothetical protein